MLNWTFNLHEALKRLGVKGAYQHALSEQPVTPALVVGDVSNLSPVLLPPMGWFGGSVTAGGAGQYSGVQVVSMGAGGALVRYFAYRPGANGNLILSIDATNPAAGMATAVTERQMGPTPVSSIVNKGTSAVSLSGTTYPNWRAGTAQSWLLPDLIFVPRGHFATFQFWPNNNNLEFALVVQDVPAREGAV